MARVVLLALLMALLVPAQARAGETVLVVGQSGVDKADRFATASGIHPAGAMWYVEPFERRELTAILADVERAVRTHPGLVVDLGVSFGAISTPKPPRAANIAAGLHDDALREIARTLKRLPTTATLRLGYEFDLLGGQYGPPEIYKAAYRRVVDVLRAAGVTNARYVWHSAGAFWRATDHSLTAVSSGTLSTALQNAGGVDVQPISRFFPGRRYVDAFAISYWQDSCCFGRSAQPARDVYERRTRDLLGQARALGLPLMIGESTPANIGANSGAESVAWLENTFDLIEDFDIHQWNLISIDWRSGGFFAAPFWNGYWPDARLHHHRATRERLQREIVPGSRYVVRIP